MNKPAAVPSFARPAFVEAAREQKQQAEKHGLNDRQQSQIAVIRHELIGLRDILKPYVE